MILGNPRNHYPIASNWFNFDIQLCLLFFHGPVSIPFRISNMYWRPLSDPSLGSPLLPHISSDRLRRQDLAFAAGLSSTTIFHWQMLIWHCMECCMFQTQTLSKFMHVSKEDSFTSSSQNHQSCSRHCTGEPPCLLSAGWHLKWIRRRQTGKQAT